MSEESFSEVTETGYFSRIKSSIVGIGVGIILILIASGLLFWNEGRTVKRKKTLDNGQSQVITVDAKKVDKSNDGKLVCVSGEAISLDTLKDYDFNISVNAIHLNRSVSIYQWQEKTKTTKKKKVGGKVVKKTTYSYNKIWSPSLINSDEFKRSENHVNSKYLKYKSVEQNASNVKLGEYSLNSSQINKIKGSQSVTIKELPAKLKDSAIVTDNQVYFGKDPANPKIGDMKISFSYTPNSKITVVAQQNGNDFSAFKTETGSIQLLKKGILTSTQMFKAAKADNNLIKWILRLVGIVFMFIGFSMLFKPLAIIGDLIPFVGSIIGIGAGLISGVLTLVLSLVIIAIAWITYRPLLGISLLAVVCLLIAFVFSKRKRKR